MHIVRSPQVGVARADRKTSLLSNRQIVVFVVVVCLFVRSFRCPFYDVVELEGGLFDKYLVSKRSVGIFCQVSSLVVLVNYK